MSTIKISPVSLRQVEVTRKMAVWTPVQYFQIVETITSFFKLISNFTLKITDESMMRTISYYDIKCSSIKIEPQLVKGSYKVWRLRLSHYPLEVHYILPNNSSLRRIEEVSIYTFKEFEKSVKEAMFYELNPDTDSWRFKRVVFP